MMIFYLCAGSVHSQVFPNLSGTELYNAVVEKYKPNYVELYSSARIKMYKEIYNIRDTVHTIYTDHTVYLPPSEQLPIQYLAQEASKDGINAEHIYPRSKGAKEENGNAFSDLHNLAPARWEVNEARSNYPFGEINDAETQCWFSKNIKLNTTESLSPASINDYAEVKSDKETFMGVFEPREGVKGDIARSVFYFYTMYRQEAIESDPKYFEKMQNTLCKWHNEDTIDSLEMQRNMAKAAYQDGQPNPFILDCSLANRLYCAEHQQTTCDQFTTSLAEIKLDDKSKINPVIKILPNPNDGTFVLDISSISPGSYRLDIFYSTGQLLYSIEEDFDYFNSINMWNAKNGMHYIHMIDNRSGRKYSGTFIVQR